MQAKGRWLTWGGAGPALPAGPAMPTDSAGRSRPADDGAVAPGPPPKADAFSLYAGWATMAAATLADRSPAPQCRNGIYVFDTMSQEMR